VAFRQCPTPQEVSQLLGTVSDVYRYPTRVETTMLYLHTEAGRVTSPLNNYNDL
jgi:hypothetical protein